MSAAEDGSSGGGGVVALLFPVFLPGWKISGPPVFLLIRGSAGERLQHRPPPHPRPPTLHHCIALSLEEGEGAGGRGGREQEKAG